MWTSMDYDKLKTLSQVIEDVGEDGVFGDVDIDEASKQAIIAWFNFRKVCDNTYFVKFFQRQLTAYLWQYDQYLRLQSVAFDPMVADYMERQIIRKGDRKDSSTRKTTTTNDLTTTTDGSTSGSTTGKTTNNLKTTSNGSTENNSEVTVSGTDTTDTDSTVTGTGTIDVLDDGTSENTRNGTNNNKSLSAQLPQSSVNQDGVFPENLNWQYLTQQDESRGTNSDTDNGKTHNDQTTTRNTQDTTAGTSTLTRDMTTAGHDTGTTESTIDNTGTVDTEGQTSGTSNSTTTNTGTVVGDETGSVDSQSNDDTRERYTGRHESPQDLLDRARKYITSTNAFNWLVAQLEPCFMGVYDI